MWPRRENKQLKLEREILSNERPDSLGDERDPVKGSGS